MITKTWKIYGAEGHRQRESFGESFAFRTEDGCTVIICCEDITETNDYVIMKITAPTEKELEEEFKGQLSDGVFENSRVGKIIEIGKTRKENQR